MMELGMIGRGEHAEIVAFVGGTVDSELSGNMIDICPVGALTSKPFRYAARTWELVAPQIGVAARRASAATSSSRSRATGCCACCRSRTRRSTSAGSPTRTASRTRRSNARSGWRTPMIREGGEWRAVDWQTALERRRRRPEATSSRSTVAAAIGALAVAACDARGDGTCGEARCAASVRQHRLPPAPDRFPRRRRSAPASRWLGMPVADVDALDRVLVVGSFLRKDHPLIAQRLRQAARHGAQVSCCTRWRDDWLIPIAHNADRAAVAMAEAARRDRGRRGDRSGKAGADGAGAGRRRRLRRRRSRRAAARASARRVLLGNGAASTPEASQLHALAQRCAEMTGATLRLPHRSGGHGRRATSRARCRRRRRLQCAGDARRTRARPTAAARRARIRLRQRRSPRARRSTQADFVVVLTPFGHGTGDIRRRAAADRAVHRDRGHVRQLRRARAGFHGVVPPLGETRPAWKVLRVLGTLLGLPGFDFDTIEDVRAAAACRSQATLAARLRNDTRGRGRGARRRGAAASSASPTCRSISPIRWCAARRRCSGPPMRGRRAHGWPLRRCSARHRRRRQVRVRQGRGEAVLAASVDARLPPGVVRIAAAHASTCGLEGLSGPIAGRARRLMDAVLAPRRAIASARRWVVVVDACSRSSPRRRR